MSETIPSYCRACEGFCGVQLKVQGGRITEIDGDPLNPFSAGHLCPVGQATIEEPHAEGRPLRPRKRVGTEWQEVEWDQAISEIGASMAKLRREHTRGIGLYAGPELAFDHRGAIRAAAWALGSGTPNLFSPLAMYGASRLRAVESIVGAAVPLTSDVGRAHYTVLIGSDQQEARWGPLQSGTIHTQAQDYFRKRRQGTKLIVVDPRATPTALDADEHIQIKPGTEPWYLLGLAHATLFNNWTDAQYLRDYCTGVDDLREWLAPWTPQVCADICGIDVGELSGVGLKFGRAAMATILPSATVCQSHMGTVASWAWLVTSALTANLLRPGGHYESGGLIDMHPVLATLPSERAPKSRVSGMESLLLQLPGTVLAEEILTTGEGQLKGLIVVGGCPLQELPGRKEMDRALEALELLVVLDNVDSETAAKADWVLPTEHFWERGDLHLLDNALLPSVSTQATAPVLQAPESVRSIEWILKELFSAAKPSLRGEWGRHLRLTGRMGATANLDDWVARILDWSGLPDEATLRGMPHGMDEGETDRSQWRPTQEDERLHLAPDVLRSVVMGLKAPTEDAAKPFRLLTAARWPGGWGWRHRVEGAEEPGIILHPEAGFADGQTVRVKTSAGEVQGPVRLDASQHPIGVTIPWGWAIPAGELVGTDHLDPITGAPEQSGLPCSVQAV